MLRGQTQRVLEQLRGIEIAESRSSLMHFLASVWQAAKPLEDQSSVHSGKYFGLNNTFRGAFGVSHSVNLLSTPMTKPLR